MPHIKRKPKTELDAYDRHADDSSDEESTKAVEDYDIATAWQSYIGDEETETTELFSFVAHAIGISLLYSTEVNGKYYELKGQYLYSESEERRNTIAKEKFRRITQKAFDRFCGLYLRKHDEEKLSKATREKLWGAIFPNDVQESCATKIAHDARQANHISGTLSDELDQMLDEAFEKLLAQMGAKRIVYRAAKQYDEKIRPDSADLVTLGRGIVETLKAEIRKHTTIGPDNWGKFRTKLGIAKGEALSSQIEKIVKTVAGETSLNGDVKKKLAELLAGCHWSMGLPKCFDKLALDIALAETFLMKTNLDCDDTWRFVSRIPGLIKYHDITRERAKTRFHKLMKNALNVSIDFGFRKTLPNFFASVSSNPYSFYSHLRLSNRSQKRNRRNLQNHKNDPLFSIGMTVQRGWSFEGYETCALEDQKLTRTEFGRSDRVVNFSTYKDLNKNIKVIKEKHRITDSDIAQWVRDIFTGNSESLTNFPSHLSDDVRLGMINQLLVPLTYMLFGCEVARNPAMLVLNQMLLDLIWLNPDEFTWEILFSDSLENVTMPMAPTGAVVVARKLEGIYSTYMPFVYKYEGSSKFESSTVLRDAEDLQRLEASIVENWLIQQGVEYEDKGPDELVELLTERIKDEYECWFGEKPEQMNPEDEDSDSLSP